jgi:hypothetical protein
MKKALSALLVALALAVGGAAIYFYQKPALGGGSAKPMAADFLPGQTLALLAFPDPAQTLADWRTTDLYKIWTEPEVQAFLERPLSKIPKSKEFDDTLASIVKLDPKNLFIALASLEEKTNLPHVIAGFQFKGSSADVEKLLAAPKDLVRKSTANGKADLLNYQGRSIETFDDGNGTTVGAVFLNDWYFISNDVALLKSTLDRIEGRAPASSPPTLDKDADFQAVLAKMPAGSETLIFGRVQPFMTRLIALTAASGQPMNPEQRAEAEKIKAIGATTAFEKGKIRDTIYYLAPGLKQELAKLQMSSLPLTSADTIFYGASVLDIPAKIDLPANNPALAVLGGFLQELQKRGVTLESFRAAFGREAGAQLDWPANNPQPGLILSLSVQDRPAADKFLESLVSLPVEPASWQKAQANGSNYYSLNVPNVPFLSPTLTVTDKHLILGLNPPDVRTAVGREPAGGGAVAQSETYKTAASAVGKPNVSFAYLDSKAFFERLYGGSLRQALVMGAAIFAPQIGDYADLGKLPNTETISKHLSPIVFSQSLDGDGLTFESVGTVTFAQALIGVGAGAGAAAVPMMQKQFGLPAAKPSKPAPADVPDEMPSATPAAPPGTSPAPGKNE